MNNRYTYKAKRKDNGEWVYGYLVEWVNCCTVYMNAPSPKRSFIFPFENRGCLQTLENHIEVDSKTLCACTGLSDIEGKDIFENDILTVVGRKYTVEFKNGMFGVMINNNTKFIDLYWWISENKKAGNKYKIIGNKFDKENSI